LTVDVASSPAASSRVAIVAACLYTAMVAAAVGHFLLGIPIQVTDSFGNMLKLATPWRELLVNEFTQHSYLRPFLWAELKVVYDASGGRYFEWFRGVHVTQVAILLAFYLAIVRPRTWRDAAIVPLGLAVLLGMHTFRGTVVEAFPVNTFLTVVLCCFAAAFLALMKNRWWVDLLALLLFVVAALTVESGLLVAVIFIGAALVGAKGLSRAGLAMIVLALIGYFVLRFSVLNVGSPGLIERSSGYGFAILEPPQLIEKFGTRPLWFYAYNIVTSALSVLFSEPRGGVFWVTRGVVGGEPYYPAIVNAIASMCGTILLAYYAWRRRRQWLALDFDYDDRLVLIFAIVLAANATISYPYTKDVIMSPAGAFYAVAVFAAARGVLPDRVRPSGMIATVAATVVCAALSVTWAVRFMALPMNLRESAYKVRNEWAYVHDWLGEQTLEMRPPAEQQLLRQLREDAIYRHPAPPRLPAADNEWLDVD
jgi:hypothetical protein